MPSINRRNVGVEVQEIKIEISDDVPSSAQVTFSVQGLEYPGSTDELTLRVPCQSHTVDEVIDHAYSALNTSLKAMIEKIGLRHQQKNLPDS